MDKEQLLATAQEILDASTLADEAKVLWTQQLALATGEKIQLFIEMASDEHVLNFATESLQRKLAAQDSEIEMKKVVDAEVEQLKALIKEDLS
jgi:hypothetical protein